jgi:hypothetical protein
VQVFFEVHEIAALPQAHLLSQPGKLIEVRRIVSDPPNSGLRQVVKFHAIARSDFREPPISATVRSLNLINSDKQRKYY